MRSALVLAPLALYSAACALEPGSIPPQSPATEWEERPQAPPEPVVFQPSPRADTIARWQLPSDNAWARFAKLTLVMAMGVAPRTEALVAAPRSLEVTKAEAAARSLAQTTMAPDAMWIVDLHGAASVAFGATLSQHALVPIANVLTFNNWPAENELVPAEETLAALVHTSPKLPPRGASAARPVFLLDAWRLAYKGTEPDDDTTDNRYYLTPSDLPDSGHLRAAGLRSVYYVVASLREHPQEEDDLHAIFLDYQQAGITLHIVDLDGLTRPVVFREPAPEPEAIVPYDEPRLLWVETRPTVLDDPYFYGRSQGGFGGLHGGGHSINVGGGHPITGGGGHHGGGSFGVGWGGGGG